MPDNHGLNVLWVKVMILITIKSITSFKWLIIELIHLPFESEKIKSSNNHDKC